MSIVDRLRGKKPCRDLVALRNDAANVIELLRRELQLVVDWTTTEKAPLRDLEIESIRALLADTK